MLDNRPRRLLLGGVPESTPVKAILRHFKSFGLIDEIDLQSAEKTIAFATHEAAVKALARGGRFVDESGAAAPLQLEWHVPAFVRHEAEQAQNEEPGKKNEPAPTAAAAVVPVTVAAAATAGEEEEEEDEDGDKRNWKR